MQAVMKYTPTCIHKALNSGSMSDNDAPILLMRRNPRTPKVLGKSQAMLCHIPGILACGQEIPVINSNGTEVNTTNSITFSLYLTRHDMVREKKIHAKMNGKRNPKIVVHVTMDTKPNNLGMARARYIPMTAYIMK